MVSQLVFAISPKQSMQMNSLFNSCPQNCRIWRHSKKHLPLLDNNSQYQTYSLQTECLNKKIKTTNTREQRKEMSITERKHVLIQGCPQNKFDVVNLKLSVRKFIEILHIGCNKRMERLKHTDNLLWIEKKENAY